MKLSYRTQRLPQNFLALGYLLIVAGVWISLFEDWKGIFFLLGGFILILVESGIIIDTSEKTLRQYTGLFFLKIGQWQDISRLIGLVVAKTRESQSMHVLSISRSVNADVYKLWLIMPQDNIELMTGARAKVIKRAEVIAKLLETSFSVEEPPQEV